jgi:acetolactate synthase-1/2/3 large subunit
MTERKTTKASDLFVRALENEGVEVIFAVPGEENLDLLNSLRTSKIRVVLNRHEQAAGFMAATYGRLTGNAGVCLSTLGPGATNFMTAAAYAHLGAFPMIMITGQKPSRHGRQGRFQIVDIVATMKPVTKMAKAIVDATAIPSIISDAFRVAEVERPGPVHLELPEDVAAEKIPEEPLAPRSRARLPQCPETALDTAADMIRAASHPLLVVGAGANRRPVFEALDDFVRRTRIPFVTTQMGKGAVGGSHDEYLGTAALSEGDYIHKAFDAADLIINAGHDVVEKPPFLMRHGGPNVIHVNFSPAEIDEVYFPNVELLGEIGPTFRALTKKLKHGCHHDPAPFYAVRDEVATKVNTGADDDRFPMLPQRIVADVRRALPSDGIVSLDNGMYKIWFARSYRAQHPNTLLLDNALATMGAGLPQAMAAAMLNPGKRVLALAGDGGFMMNSQELETAVRLGLNFVVLILRDDAYGMIRWKQAVGGFADWGLTYGNPDFVAYAESYGVTGHRVPDAASFRPMLEAAFEAGGVHLIDAAIDYSENTRVLIDELKEMQNHV